MREKADKKSGAQKVLIHAGDHEVEQVELGLVFERRLLVRGL